MSFIKDKHSYITDPFIAGSAFQIHWFNCRYDHPAVFKLWLSGFIIGRHKSFFIFMKCGMFIPIIKFFSIDCFKGWNVYDLWIILAQFISHDSFGNHCLAWCRTWRNNKIAILYEIRKTFFLHRIPICKIEFAIRIIKRAIFHF